LIITNTPAVSIIVCGKNEAKQFHQNIPIILNQDYPNFEVVIVDDHSTDNTQQVIEQLMNEYPNLKLVYASAVPNRPGKKSALYEGVKSATNEWVIVTDADCIPTSKDWISHLSSKMNESTNLILGISPNHKNGGLTKRLFRYETILTAMLYISLALRNLPYMGVGRNMAFRKSIFLTEFVHILEGDIASGDDDLYVNFVADSKSTAICLHPDSFTVSDSPESILKWIKQKRRHLSAGFQYKVIHQAVLILFPLAQWTMLIGFIALMFTELKWFALLLASFQFLVQQIVHSNILKKMDQLDIALDLPIYQLIWMVLQPYLTFTSLFQSKTKWN